MPQIKVPKYSELPIQEGALPGSSWGVFDKDGKKDVYGTLNFITPKLWQSVVLNLPMHLPYNASRMGRKEFTLTPISDGHGMKFCDDEIHINTQSSSQWDGLLHWPHQERACYYNGISYASAGQKREDKSLAIQSLSERGGIVARGILLDFPRYASRNGITYSPLGPYAITHSQLLEMISDQNLTPRQADVLLIRTGLSQYLRSATREDKMPADSEAQIGVDPTPELLAWLWDTGFAAVGSDAVAVEAIPASDGSCEFLFVLCLPRVGPRGKRGMGQG
ncbi:cyclase-like protein 3 [Elsinoe australis]|uniref:Cyclase-like protein 3 n=1 Tax=Elsinoe australis TaxID=40998 RepID=A0A4U7AWE1_9PEZI|nr:cyclase-like protein 3 [Elsinoe australis]